jgi:hypothetical protein
MEAGINFLIAGGYTGQTTEILAGVEQVVGIYLSSYVSASCTYHFGRSRP